jgi:hypothetical protein
MPKFFVKVQEVHTQTIEVDAEDHQSAQAAAEEVLSAGVNQDGTDLEEKLEYSHTLDRNEWRVWEKE